MERFERICFIDGMLWSHDCPVLLEKGSLLIDTKKNINVLQLKFRNLQETTISAVYLIIKQKDVMGNVLGDIERFYLDLSVKSNEYFGNSVPIELTFKQARSFDYIVSTIVFADGTKWQSSECLMPIATPNKLTDLNDLKDQFKIEVHKLNYTVVCENLPYQGDGYWICTCGYFNLDKKDKCAKCNIDKKKLYEVSNTNHLITQKHLIEQLNNNKNITVSDDITPSSNINNDNINTSQKSKQHKIIGGIILVLTFMVLVIWNSNSNKDNNQITYNTEGETILSAEKETDNRTSVISSDDPVLNICNSIEFNSTPNDVIALMGDDYDDLKGDYYGRYSYVLNYTNDYKLNDFPGKLIFKFDKDNKLYGIEWNHELDHPKKAIYYELVEYLNSYLGKPVSSNDTTVETHTYWRNYYLEYYIGSIHLKKVRESVGK